MKTLRFIKIIPQKSTLREISFEGNKPNRYERKLKSDLKKSAKRGK